MSPTLIMRCPKCGSTEAHVDESRSHFDLWFMCCSDCGEGVLTDLWERNEDWYITIDLEPDAFIPKFVSPLGEGQRLDETLATARKREFGCDTCFGTNADLAWRSSRGRVRSLVRESHFGVFTTCCSCSQKFVVIFTERIDWAGGNDSQTWLVMPVTDDEEEELRDDSTLISTITSLGRERRFLVRDYPSDGEVLTCWRNGGLVVGPHD